MAGMAAGRGGSDALSMRMQRDGFVYNQAAGGWVNGRTINPATGRPYSAGTNVINHQDGSVEERDTGRMTNVPNRGMPGASASGGGSGGGGRSGTSGGSGGGGGGNADEIRRIIEEIRRGSQPYEPEQATPHTAGSAETPYDQAAERAAYGSAKERTGLATQSALRALREQLNTRGMMGGGLDAEMTTGIVRGGLGELADTDRDLAAARSGRAYESQQRDTDRLNDMSKFNASLRDKAVSGRPSYDLSRWSLLAQLAGMY